MRTTVDGTDAVDVRDVIGRLAHELGGAVALEVIAERVRLECDRFTGARVGTYVPLLVERRVRRQLRDRVGDARPDVRKSTAS